MCPAGLHVSEYLLFCRKVLVQREKLAKVRKIDKLTYTYREHDVPGYQDTVYSMRSMDIHDVAGYGT